MGEDIPRYKHVLIWVRVKVIKYIHMILYYVHVVRVKRAKVHAGKVDKGL